MFTQYTSSKLYSSSIGPSLLYIPYRISILRSVFSSPFRSKFHDFPWQLITIFDDHRDIVPGVFDFDWEISKISKSEWYILMDFSLFHHDYFPKKISQSSYSPPWGAYLVVGLYFLALFAGLGRDGDVAEDLLAQADLVLGAGEVV